MRTQRTGTGLTEQLLVDDEASASASAFAYVAATSDETAFAAALLDLDEPGSGDVRANSSMALHDSIDDGEPHGGDADADLDDEPTPSAEALNMASAAIAAALVSDLYREAAIAEARMTRLRTAFALFDTDGSGDICCDELAAVMTALGRSAGPMELQEMVGQADLNNDGRCDFAEFCIMMEGKL